MATLTERAEQLADKLSPPTTASIPQDVQEKLKRGKNRLDALRAQRRQAVEFANNNHYAWLAADGLRVNQQNLVAESYGGERPNHRVRLSHDQIGPILKRKISASTQRIPGYEVTPSTSDPEDYSASKLSENVLNAGYELWRVRRAFKKLVWNALVTDEGFIMAYWNSNIGPFVNVSEDPENPSHLGMGEVNLIVYDGREVLWEPGVEFDQTRWYAIEHARPIDEVEAEPEFIIGGGKLKPDAAMEAPRTSGNDPSGQKLVLVTEYLERPCPKYPEGRKMVFANKRLIFPEDSYPLRDHDGQVIDEPCMHRLSYQIDGSSDRDKGLVRSLIDPMRQYDSMNNKAMEFIQTMLIPKYSAPEGAITTPITDEPGQVVEYDVTASAGQPPEALPQPQMPREFLQYQERSLREMSEISFDNELTNVESAKGIQAIVAQNEIAWQDFVFDLAEVYARVGRDSLTLVQRHYTEDRMVKFRGRTGWESIADFRGADLRGQTDVRVQPGSLEPRTRAGLEQRILNIAERFPNAFPPEVVVAALNSATPDKLMEGYEEDVARAQRVIAQIRSGVFWSQPPRPALPGEEAPLLNPETGQPVMDEQTGEPIMLSEVPGWMPRPFDNIPVQKSQMEQFMKSDEWDFMDNEKKRASLFYYQSLLDLEAKKAQRDAELQTEQAESLGLANAAAPQGKLPPSRPALESGEGEGPVGP